MYLIRVGKRLLNLEYLIVAEQWDGTEDTAALRPGDVRVTLESGRVISLRNGDAAKFLKCVNEILPEDPDEPCGVVGRPLDPETGKPLVRPDKGVSGG